MRCSDPGGASNAQTVKETQSLHSTDQFKNRDPENQFLFLKAGPMQKEDNKDKSPHNLYSPFPLNCSHPRNAPKARSNSSSATMTVPALAVLK